LRGDAGSGDAGRDVGASTGVRSPSTSMRRDQTGRADVFGDD
jgi:hypothetical protein